MDTTSTADDLRGKSDEELKAIAGDPPPLTREQRALATLDRRQDVRRAIRVYARSATAGFLILLAGVAGAFKVQADDRAANRERAAEQRQAIVVSGNAVAVQGCNRDFDFSSRQRVALRKRGLPEPEVIELVPLPDCRPAAESVTDDPNRPVTVPEPRYPGDTKGG